MAGTMQTARSARRPTKRLSPADESEEEDVGRVSTHKHAWLMCSEGPSQEGTAYAC